MTTTKAQKIRVGLFTAVTIALLGVVIVVFGGFKFWKKHDHYRIELTGSVYGLENGAQVYLNGLRVGAVTDIGLAPDDLRKVQVKIAVDAHTPIRTDTRAILQYAGITGLKVIDLRDGTLAAPVLPEGGLIAQGETVLDKFELQAKTIADESTILMKRANQIVANLVVVTDPRDYQAIMKSAQATTSNLAETSSALHSMIDENRAVLHQSMVSIKDTAASMNETAKSASQMLDGQVSGMVASASDLMGEVKGFVRDNGSVLKAAMLDLRQASRSFKDLAREVRQKPSRLLFSKSAGDRKMP
jgi:phospholipid/cholesterol/gamma-HCH transport system substrate-binding protein